MQPAERAQAHEESAAGTASAAYFSEVYATQTPFVWRTLRRLGVHPNDLEDVAQEVFVVVHRRLHEFDARFSIRAWLFAIARRVASDHRRRAHHHREEVTDQIPEVELPATQVESVARRQARAKLESLLALLSDDKREVFVLFEFEQLPMQEIADAIGCPLQTAYSRLRSARETIQTAIQKHQTAEVAR